MADRRQVQEDRRQMQDGDIACRSRSPARHIRNEIFDKFELKENPNTVTATAGGANGREYYSGVRNQSERFQSTQKLALVQLRESDTFQESPVKTPVSRTPIRTPVRNEATLSEIRNDSQEIMRSAHKGCVDKLQNSPAGVCLFCQSPTAGEPANRNAGLDCEACMFCHKPVVSGQDKGFYTPNKNEMLKMENSTAKITRRVEKSVEARIRTQINSDSKAVRGTPRKDSDSKAARGTPRKTGDFNASAGTNLWNAKQSTIRREYSARKTENLMSTAGSKEKNMMRSSGRKEKELPVWVTSQMPETKRQDSNISIEDGAKASQPKPKKHNFMGNFQDMMHDNAILEEKRKNLSLRPDFNIQEMFGMVNYNKNGFLTVEEFAIFVQKNPYLNLNASDIDLLFSRYDKDQDGVLSFHEFLSIFVPKTKEYRRNMMSRPEKGVGLFANLTCATQKMVKDLFKALVYIQINMEYNKADLSQGNWATSQKLFTYMDRYKDGFITYDEFERTLKDNG